MKSMTPIRDLTAAARAGLSGNWGKSIGVTVVYIILSVGIGLLPFVGKLLQLIFSAPLVVGATVYFLATIRRQEDNRFSLMFDGFNRFGTAVCTCLLVVLIMLAWMLPFFGVMAALAFIHPASVVFPPSAVAVFMALAVLILVAGANGQPGQSSPGFTISWMVFLVAIFYFVMIRPQRRREKERRSLIEAVKSGDRVLLTSGIIGEVTNVKEKTLIVLIAEKTKIEVLKSAVSQILDEKGELPSEVKA